MKKSYFDTMYKKVLRENFGHEDEGHEGDSDLDALGLDDATPDSEQDDDFGGEGEDTVTFTLDRATAQTLIDVLQGAMGEGDDEFGDEAEGDLDFNDEDHDEEDHNFEEDNEEAVKTKNSGKPSSDGKTKLQGKSNKVAFTAAKGATYNSEAGFDGSDVGTDGTAPSYKALTGHNNKVPGAKLAKGKSYF